MIDSSCSFLLGRFLTRSRMKVGLRYNVCLPAFCSCKTMFYQFRRSVSHLLTNRCYKTSFVSSLAFITCTLVAQIVLTLSEGKSGVRLVVGGRVFTEPNRIYAVSGRSRLIAAPFSLITTAQLALGVYRIFLAATLPGGSWIYSGSLAISPL